MVLHVWILQVGAVGAVSESPDRRVDQVRVQHLAPRSRTILVVDVDDVPREEMLIILEPLCLDAMDYIWKSF